MQFTTALSMLAIATTAVASAIPAAQDSTASLEAQVKQVAAQRGTSDGTISTVTETQCIPPILCCGSLTTPLDPLVDPILLDLGIDASNIVGSIGLLCKDYDDSCTSAPQCCTEINLLNGLVALGCSSLEQ
ncbi:fungal hydrophobin [Aspergillus niger]|uniref:Hydrophobin n=1 Tax=Aspergillus niger TaxID=5061 RepID=A0A9W6A379_ASPNG|nr:fungal hydrophobin [Aspergillus niger]KAI2915651.1 fungal hydrophobin [Aspergillus niger]KAI2933083.1 fungal hydrophobin [Aspergillus niger]KAI2940343.1 fungal hydrophobin [Aspergillus niger]KAI2972112.1 fungal hydrophobin [Aspergillus niger]